MSSIFLNNQSEMRNKQTVFRAAGSENFLFWAAKKDGRSRSKKCRVFSLCFEDFEDENKRKEDIEAVRDSSIVSKSLFDVICIRNVSHLSINRLSSFAAEQWEWWVSLSPHLLPSPPLAPQRMSLIYCLVVVCLCWIPPEGLALFHLK